MDHAEHLLASDCASLAGGPLPESIIQLREVVKVYVTGAGGFTAIGGIDLDVYRGEFLGIIGKSGAGKTTLLNLISGVSQITSGEVTFRDHGVDDGAQALPVSVGHMDENELAEWRGRSLGIIHQSFELIPQLNVMQNVMLPQDFLGSFQKRISRERALALLDQVHLLEHAFKRPAQTSGGQKQRIAIARAMVNDPPVIIADEPTGNLDSVTARTILEIFESLVNQGKTIIMVTHDRSLARRFSRVVTMSDGRITSSDGRHREPPDQAERSAEPQPSSEAASAPEPILDARARIAPTAERPMGATNPEINSTSAEKTKAEGAIILRDVVKTYVNAAGEFPALRGVDLQIDYGRFISLIGKSGCGKSTLLNMLTGIDHPTSGEVIVGGKNVSQMTESERAHWRGHNIGIVFQFFQLLPTLTLLENTMLPMDYCRLYRSGERPQRAMELLALVGLADQAHMLPASVSSGQQQSAAIARALANDPPIIVADEPTGNLDSRSAESILDLFAKLAGEGKTILIVTHDPSLAQATDQTMILSDGELVDDAVARSMPMLTHPQMLRVTHRLEQERHGPGSVIVQQGDRVPCLYMIAGGSAEVVLTRPGHRELCLARLRKGQHFGEIELLSGEGAIASVRAAPGAPLDLSLLPKDLFCALLSESPATHQLFNRIAQERSYENQALRGEDGA